MGSWGRGAGWISSRWSTGCGAAAGLGRSTISRRRARSAPMRAARRGPRARGPAAAILEEARRLEGAGVRELILIAQDTTDYGHDLGMRDGLAQLLEALV